MESATKGNEMTTYRTFLRSCLNWQQFANARKITRDRGLTYSEAHARCLEFNANRTPQQIRKGTKLEFDAK